MLCSCGGDTQVAVSGKYTTFKFVLLGSHDVRVEPDVVPKDNQHLATLLGGEGGDIHRYDVAELVVLD